MPQIRFATARSLLDAFPELSNKLSILPADEGPIDFLRRLLALGKLEDGITFCAHLLPRHKPLGLRCVKPRQRAQLRDEGFLAAAQCGTRREMRAALRPAPG